MKTFIFMFFAVYLACAACARQPEQTLEPKPQRFRIYDLSGYKVYEWYDEFGRACTAVISSSGKAIDCDWRKDVQAPAGLEAVNF